MHEPTDGELFGVKAGLAMARNWWVVYSVMVVKCREPVYNWICETVEYSASKAYKWCELERSTVGESLVVVHYHFEHRPVVEQVWRGCVTSRTILSHRPAQELDEGTASLLVNEAAYWIWCNGANQRAQSIPVSECDDVYV